MSGFVSNQEYIYSSLIAGLNNNVKISIVKGRSGSGKSYLVESLQRQVPNCHFYKLGGDRCNKTRSYYPFRNLLNDVYTSERVKLSLKLGGEAIHNTLNQAGSISPLGAEAISSCITELSGIGKKKRQLYNFAFNSDEIDLLFPIDYFCGGSGGAVFLADDLQYWDDSSLQLLYMLIKRQDGSKSFLKNALFVATINTSVSASNETLSGLEKEAGGHLYTLDSITLPEYEEVLKVLGCTVELADGLVSALYSITDGNLQLTADIVFLLQDHSQIEETIRQIVTQKNLGHLVVERLNEIKNDGSLINDALKYGSLFGNSFYYHDLEPALNLQESRIRALIGTAQDYSLVRGTTAGADFVHELIRETYQKEADDNKIKYYIGFSKCLKILHPSDYLARADSLHTAGEYEEAKVIYILNFIKELRSHKTPDSSALDESCSSMLKDYIKLLRCAYRAFDEGEYRQCLNTLDDIEDIYPQPLLAEKYYLVSITLSKWLDSRSRKRAKACLEPYLEIQNIDGETEVWERVLSAYIVACVHNNEVELAQQYEKELNKSITTRIDFDLQASFRLNTLRRKASSLHPPAASYRSAKKSKDFFAPRATAESGGAPLDPVEYYISLTNYLAAALMAGKASDVFHDAGILINLPFEYSYLKFPRYEMPLNNAVIVAFLNGSVSAVEAGNELQNVLHKCDTENTTAVIIRVNIAIFTALYGDFDLAQSQLEALEKEILKIENLEYYYSYLIRVNLAAVQIAAGRFEDGMKLLEEIKKEPLFRFDELLEAHALALLDTCRVGRHGRDPQWFQKMLLMPNSLEDTFLIDSWGYYGHTYLFGELEFWSES